MIRAKVLVAALAVTACSDEIPDAPYGSLSLKCEGIDYGGSDWYFFVMLGETKGWAYGKWSTAIEAGRPMPIATHAYRPYYSVEVSETAYRTVDKTASDGVVALTIARSDGKSDLIVTENVCTSIPNPTNPQPPKPPQCEDRVTFGMTGFCNPASAPAATQKF